MHNFLKLGLYSAEQGLYPCDKNMCLKHGNVKVTEISNLLRIPKFPGVKHAKNRKVPSRHQIGSGTYYHMCQYSLVPVYLYIGPRWK